MLFAYLRVCAEVCGGWLQSTICSDAEAPPSENLTRDAEGPSGPASGFPRPVQAGWGSGYHHLDVDSIWGFGPRYEEI